MKTFLEHALKLAALGFHIIPVTPGKKQKPLRKAFWGRATTDPDVIRRFWKCDPITGEGSKANPAISTTNFRDGALIVLDVDPKHGGFESLEALRVIMGYGLPDTYEQHTPSGGRHYVYWIPRACAGSNGKLDRGLDIKSHHNYILGAGARTAAGVYTAVVRPVAPAPAWLVEWAKAHPPAKKSAKTAASPVVDRREALRKAHAYLTKLAPAPDGERDACAYKAACKLRGFGLSQTDVADQMVLHFKYDEGQSSFGSDDIEHATESAFKYAKSAAGEDAPETYFRPIADPEPPEVPAPAPEAPKSASPGQETASPEDVPGPKLDPTDTGDQRGLFNLEHAFVMVGSKARVMWETLDHHGRPRREFLEIPAFHDKYAGYTMVNGDGSKVLEASKQWLRWHGRRSYDGVVFAPGRKLPPRFYNTWRGFAYEPLARGEVPTAGMKEAMGMLTKLVHENMCGGSDRYTKYVWAYFAHMIQKPEQKPRVALVFKGGKGVGKSTIAQVMGNLVEPHLFVAPDLRYLLGNFNAHMGDTLFFVLEEAVWAGNKNAESSLKELVTGGKVNIEQKFRDAFRADNYMRIAIIGNADWQVPASLKDERRWAVFKADMRFMPFETEPDKEKAARWFDRLYSLMAKGGYRYLLTHLMQMDIGDVDVNRAPVTDGLIEQIHLTLSPVHQWWLECLSDGRIVDGDFPGWPRDPEKSRMFDAFTRYCDNRRIDSRRPGMIAFGRELHGVCPHMQLDKKKWVEGQQSWVYRLPPLVQAREDWAKAVGRTPVWPDDEEV
jgi:hypothetical protein